MNCIKTEVYPGYNLSSNEVSFQMQRGIHPVETQKMGRSREMRLRRIKLKNGCHERSLIFAIQSRFKIKELEEEKIRVPTGCILSVGTVPTDNLSLKGIQITKHKRNAKKKRRDRTLISGEQRKVG